MNHEADGAMLRDMMTCAAKLLENNRSAVDALNVFPVPDGDTGTNMSLTLISAVREMNGDTAMSAEQVAEAVARGALKGARGNSGVILSQIFRGMAKGLAGAERLDGKTLSAALSAGVQTAYKAVIKPKEGTMLTVARMVAEEIEKEVRRNSDLRHLVRHMIQKGEQVLAQTPDMLPVLKQAGVVDAGGKGLVIIYQGFLAALEGDALEDIEIEFEFGNVQTAQEEPHNLDFPYCTEFFIQNFLPGKTERDIDRFREKLTSIGDCVLVVGDSALTKVHVHVADPGKAISFALKLGELNNLKIDNMRYQHRNEMHEADALKPKNPRRKSAMVAVSMGEGLDRIFQDLGVVELVGGGQTMNPSIGDLAAAILRANAEDVYVLPNNSNIILAARQAAQDTAECRVHVVSTKSVPQGIAAAVLYQEDTDAVAMAQSMERAAKQVKTGQVTAAVRDSAVNDMVIRKDDIIGLCDGAVSVVGGNLEEVAFDLVAHMATEPDGLITIYIGEQADEEAAKALFARVESAYPDFDVEMHMGGQPIYAYLVSVE